MAGTSPAMTLKRWRPGMTATVEACRQTSAVTLLFAPFEWMVVFRYLRAERAEVDLGHRRGSSFGMAPGVAALIVVMSVMNGFRHDLMEKMIGAQPPPVPARGRDPATDHAGPRQSASARFRA